jgi:uncharacterized membrane protein YhiD involved in acid resistance
MKRIAIAITCGFALALTAVLAQTVIMQRQWNLVAQQNEERIEARRLKEQQQQQQRALEQQRLEARRLEEQQQQQQLALEQQRLEARRLEEQQRPQLERDQLLDSLVWHGNLFLTPVRTPPRPHPGAATYNTKSADRSRRQEQSINRSR